MLCLFGGAVSGTLVWVKELGDMNINTITGTILDETSSPKKLCDAVDDFALLCGQIISIRPAPSFDAWAHGSFRV